MFRSAGVTHRPFSTELGGTSINAREFHNGRSYITYEPVMKPGDEQMMERLASLSGAEFEIAFMEMMIKHHEKAIKEGRHCLDKAYHPELRELCENIIRTQSAEIAQMQTWLCQWYGECR